MIKLGDLLVMNYWNEIFHGYVVDIIVDYSGEKIYCTKMFNEGRMFRLREKQKGKTWEVA
jgi:hypothetical protein